MIIYPMGEGMPPKSLKVSDSGLGVIPDSASPASSLVEEMDALQEPYAVHDSFEKLNVGERQVLDACIAIARKYTAQHDREASDTTTAFQNLPAELAKALNYGKPMTADDYVALAALWKSKSGDVPARKDEATCKEPLQVQGSESSDNEIGRGDGTSGFDPRSASLTRGKMAEAGSTPALPANQGCEIPVVDEDEVWRKLFNATELWYRQNRMVGAFLPRNSIMEAIRPYLATREPVSAIGKALENAAEILANFKGEPDASKLEQWQACYAMLFRQMNELVQSRKPVSGNSTVTDRLFPSRFPPLLWQ
jgi:hypothetical protein